MSRLAAGPGRALALGLVPLAFSLAFAPAAAARERSGTAADLAAASAYEDLRPGDYRWHADAASADGPLRIVVSLPLQRAFVFRGEALVGVATVSTGRPGFDTPTGTFPILQKRAEHYSNLYDNAPMPHMQRLTWDGIALHAGAIPGEPASHGCIRLPPAFARRLFALTELGTPVVVTDSAPAAPEEALALAP